MKPHKRLFSHYPLFQLLLAYAAGVVTTNYVDINLGLTSGLYAFSSLSTLACFLRRRLQIAGLLVLLSVFFAGVLLTAIENHPRPANSVSQLLETGCVDEGQTMLLTGVLDRPPELGRDRIQLILRVEEIETRTFRSSASGSVVLSGIFKTSSSRQEYERQDLHYGTRIRVTTALNRTGQFRNPGTSTLIDYLDRNGVDASGVIKNPTSIVRLDEVAVFTPIAWLYQYRETIQRTIDRRFPSDTAGVLDAALLGNRRNLSSDTVERFREGGTFHVLVISGLHVSFVGGLVLVVAGRFSSKRIFQFAISNGVVWSYSIAVGAEPSVVRAALMFTVITFGGAIFRSTSGLNALGVSGLIILCAKPRDLFDPSFQLTFLSVFAIVTIAWPLLRTFRAIGSWRPTRSSPYPPVCNPLIKTVCEALFWSERDWRTEQKRSSHHCRLIKTPIAPWLERHRLQTACSYAFSAVLVSFAVQTVLLPLLIVYFHRVSFSSLILNIFVSILMATLGFIALVGVLVAQLSDALATPLIQLASLVNWLMVHSVEPFSQLGVASIRIPEYGGWVATIYLLYYLPLSILVLSLSRWRPLDAPNMDRSALTPLGWTTAGLQIVLVCNVLLHPLSSGRPDGKLRIDFLDVGQGDAALVTMPDGTTLLIDGGGRPTFFKLDSEQQPMRDSRSIGETVVSEHLWWRGLDSVDYVLATHADADHIDGLNDVLRNFSVRSALVARSPGRDPEYAKFRETLSATGTHVEMIQAGDRLQFGDVTATVLWPPVDVDLEAASANNDSVVLHLHFGKTSVLLTGDIEKEAEAQILAANADLHADVVKVPHHGSRTSSIEAFVKSISPAYAIVSVGQKSIFGHPHKEIVERWQENGAQVLTTGKCGMITALLDGKKVTVSRFVE